MTEEEKVIHHVTEMVSRLTDDQREHFLRHFKGVLTALGGLTERCLSIKPIQRT
jgi:hypothetical protein